MVKMQLDLPDRLNRYLGIQKEICGLKDKRRVIIKLIEEKLSNDKELIKCLSRQSKTV